VVIPTLQEVIEGKCDANVGIWATASKTLQHQYVLRPGWEMNTNSSAWGGAHNFGKDSRQTWIQADSLTKYYGDPNKPDGPERYVDAWKRIHRIFREQGATNVLFLWSPLDDNYPKEKWNEATNYYPGDEYVDLVGCSLYNEGYWEDKGRYEKWWQDFEDIFQKEPIKIYNSHPSKPFWIGEMGCSEETLPGVKGTKPEWIQKAYERIKTVYPRIKGVCWFSKYYPWERDWRVNSSPEALEAYRKATSDPYFLDRIMFETGGQVSPLAVFHCAVVVSAAGRSATERRLRA
jgi:beta-mannanase